MKHYYFFIRNSEPADTRLTVLRFTAGQSQRDQQQLAKLKFVAGAYNHYLSIRDRDCNEFLMKLANSLYGQSCDAFTRFMSINVRNISLQELCAQQCTTISLKKMQQHEMV